MNIETLYNIYSKHFLVDTDTRKIRKNTLYFALKGANFNGNQFADEALKKGALYSIVDEVKYVTSSTIILVDDVLETLQKLAIHHRNTLNVPIIGLTGSNGKTTTKELINAVLSTQFKTSATVGNLNNHIGVPLTLLAMTPETEIGIVEMGANHPTEIEFLCAIANPDFGYITNFGKAHLEGFGSIEGVIEAKSELYQYLKEKNKTAFVNPEDTLQIEKTKHQNTAFFDDSISFIDANPFVKVQVNHLTIQTNLIGKYNFSNIAAAVSIGLYFNISIDNIKTALEKYTPTNNRSQIIKTKHNNTIILDAYNANPTSMKAAIDAFSLIDSKLKTVILGDMFELGEISSLEHQNLAEEISARDFNNCILIGELLFETNSTCNRFQSFDEATTYIRSLDLNNHYILIKGSRGMALERILNFIN